MKNKLIGKGEFLYDYKYDIFTFKMKDRNYSKSIEFQNFAIDIDEEKFVTGIRVFDASKVFKIDKYVLKNIIKGHFKANVENKIITITINFIGRQRNRLINILNRTQDYTQQIITPVSQKIADSTVECATA